MLYSINSHKRSKIMPNEHNGHRTRIRERVNKEGLDNFQDYQVLEYLLSFVIPYKDTNPLAHKLIGKFGSFAGVLEADEQDLLNVSGVGEVSAHFLTKLLSVYHFYEKNKVKNNITISRPEEAVNYVRPFLKGKLIEEMYLICLTPSSKIVNIEKITEGTSTEADVSIRLISDKMSRTKVSNIIIAHNHPKGSPMASDEDNRFTKALVASLAINGSHLLDHIIIGDSNVDFYSYRQTGQIDRYKQEALEHFGFSRKLAQPMAKYEVKNDKK